MAFRKTSCTTEEMLALREQGLGNAEIAEKLGVSRVTVLRRIGSQPEDLTSRNRADAMRKTQAMSTPKKVDPVDTPSEPQNAPSELLEREVAQVVEVIYASPQRGQGTLPDRVCDFADTPRWVDKLKTLARMAQPEPWQLANNDRLSTAPDVEILSSYVNTTFSLAARAYNAASESDRDKIFYFRDDIACFHTGLYTPEYMGIYAIFRPNRYVVSGGKEWWLQGFFYASDSFILQLPVLPDPWPRFALPVFDPAKRIYTYADHMLTRRDGTSRMPETVRSHFNAKLLVETAVELARRQAAADPSTVVTCPRVAGGDYLLPLYLTNPDTPDVVAIVVTTADGVHMCKTCLTLNQAYLHARTSGKVTAKWLLTAVEHGGG